MKLREKLEKCKSFFKNTIDRIEFNDSQASNLIVRLNKENTWLRAILSSRNSLLINKLRLNSINKRETPTRHLSFSGSDSEEDDSNIRRMNVAVKLLMLKYNFEHKKDLLSRHKIKDNANHLFLCEDQSPRSIEDHMKQLENLKPKQQFITIETEDNIKTTKSPPKLLMNEMGKK